MNTTRQLTRFLAASAMFVTLIGCGGYEDDELATTEDEIRYCRNQPCEPPTPPPPSTPRPNLKTRIISYNCSTHSLVFEVYNAGNATARSSTARINWSSYSTSSFYIPSLSPGASRRVSTSLYFPGGDLSFSIRADATGVVTESNESDNTAGGFCIG